MTLEAAVAILNRERHRDFDGWKAQREPLWVGVIGSGTTFHGAYSPFEAIAIARAYDASAETDALRAALAFYADEDNYRPRAESELSSRHWAPIIRDSGQRAREAIAGTAAPAAEDRFAAGRAAGLRDAAAALRRSAYDSALMAKGEAAEMFADTVEALGAADGADAGGRK